jgi:hypothetical protein
MAFRIETRFLRWGVVGDVQSAEDAFLTPGATPYLTRVDCFSEGAG